MKKFIKNNIKIFVTIIICAIFFTSITAYAVTQYYARDISFTPSKDNQDKGFNVTNVEEALNMLYDKIQTDNIDISTTYYRYDTSTSLTLNKAAEKYIVFGYSYGTQYWSGGKITSVENGTYKLLNDYSLSPHLFLIYEITPLDKNEVITINTESKTGSIFVVPINEI